MKDAPRLRDQRDALSLREIRAARGKHADLYPDHLMANDAHKIRLSSMWTPQHRKDDA